MQPIKINGNEYERLAVAGSIDKCLQYAQEYLCETEKPYVDDTGWVHKANGQKKRLYIHEWRGRIYLLRPLYQMKEQEQNQQIISIMEKTTRKSSTKKASATLKRASTILQQQKSDYKRIFKSEISKGGDSKTAAKRAGEAYRKKYGATPTARWNTARKTARRFVNA